MMKKVITLSFFALICTFTLHLRAQTYQIVNRADTLQSTDVILIRTDAGGNIIDKGLAMPGFSFVNDTLELPNPVAAPTDNVPGAFVSQVNTPAPEGGFLPQDICYNPHNGKYYIYGYRKISVCNTDLQPEQTIDISNVDNFEVFYSDFHRRMIDVNTTTNEVYCLTMTGELLSFDQYHNKTQLVPPLQSGVVHRASLMYCNADESILYFLLVTDANGSIKTLLKKYSLADATQISVVETGMIGYDIDFIPMDNHYKVYLATNQGLRKYNDDLTNPVTVEPGVAFDHIAAMNQHLFVHAMGSNAVGVYDATLQWLSNVSGSWNNLRFMLCDNVRDRLYTSGYSSMASGIDMIGPDHGNYILETSIASANVFGLAQNPYQVVACGQQEVLFIDKQALTHATQQSNKTGQMYRIAATASIGIATVVQPLNGNAITFAPAQDEVRDIGGQVSASCRKGDKIFVAIHKYNQEGYILVLNASSGKIIYKIQPAFDFNPVDMFCSDSPDITNNNIYVAYVDMDEPNPLLRMMFFSADNYQITNPDNPPVTLAGEELDHLITPNNTVVLGCVTGACGDDVFYFYDYDLQQKANPFTFTNGCIHDFVYLSRNNTNYIAHIDYCGGKVRFFSDQGLTCTLVHITAIPHVEAAVYNPAVQKLVCMKEDNLLVTIDPWNGFTTTSLTVSLAEPVKTMFYNPNDQYVYGLATNFLYRFTQAQPVEFYLPQPHSADYKHDDLIVDAAGNRCFFISKGPGNPYSATYLMRFNFTGDPEVVAVGDQYLENMGAELIKKYQGKGNLLSFYPGKENIYCAGMRNSNTLFYTTHTESRTLTGNWDWISFPCMPRLNNDPYGSQDLLENIVPLPSYIKLITSVADDYKSLTYAFQNWDTQEIPSLLSSQGYKYYSSAAVEQILPVGGIVLDPSTPIPLSSQYENWIGYFLEYSLSPRDAFAWVWDQLTRISTEDWTMILENGTIIKGPALETPISYGDGLIVEVAENCQLVWDNPSEATEDFSMPVTEYYTYDKKADYTPFYFEMDSAGSIREIALTVNDTCIGAAVVNPGDSVVEVNAYLAGTPSGVPIEVETWSGFKSARLGSRDYSVVDLPTGKRISRKIYTGEGRPYYVISFKAGQTNTASPVADLQSPSPNPFSRSVRCSFVLDRSAAVTLTVHDLQGHPVKTLMQGSYDEGYYETGWTGTTETGQPAENGIYIIRLSANGKVIANEKVVLIR